MRTPLESAPLKSEALQPVRKRLIEHAELASYIWLVAETSKEQMSEGEWWLKFQFTGGQVPITLPVEAHDRAVAATQHAALIRAWTAFECTARDAWRIAVSESELLRDRVMKTLKAQDRKIDLRDLAEARAPVEDAICDMITDKYQISSYNSICNAYAALLREKSLVSKALGTDITDDVRVCAEIRHLLVHKAGIIDEDFLDRTDFRGAKVDGPLRIPPVVQARLVCNVIVAADSLLREVDHTLLLDKASGESAP